MKERPADHTSGDISLENALLKRGSQARARQHAPRIILGRHEYTCVEMNLDGIHSHVER